jgi:hypothetical protein
MTHLERSVIGGVDCHQLTHHAVAVDDRGQRLGDHAFAATSRGYDQLLTWLQQFGRIDRLGVESTSSYGAGLTRSLLRQGIRVIEVNQPHRQLRRRKGKSDPIDAEGAARKVLSGEATAVPKDTTGSVEAIRQLHLVRASAVKLRTAALEQLGELLTTAPAELRERFAPRTSLHTRAQACAHLQPDLAHLHQPLEAAKLALRCLAQRILAMDAEIASLDAHLQPLIRSVAPRTTALLGVGSVTAAQLLISVGQNAERIGTEAAFAQLCGVAPIPASSGKTTRHRLNSGGNRHANSALYLIAVCRLRYCERTRAYALRRTAEGRSKREILRCLKRYIAREVYQTLRADLAPHAATATAA